MSKISVQSRVHRTLRRIPAFRYEIERSALLADNGFQLRPGENLIGSYSNYPDKIDEIVIVTDIGIHVRRHHEWEVIDYAEMEHATTLQEKNVAEILRITREDGVRTHQVPIRGGQGRYRDIFEFVRFLIRVIGDRKSVQD